MNSYDDIDSWLDRAIASRGMNLPMGPLAAGSLLKGHLFDIKDVTGNDNPGCIGTVFIVLKELHMADVVFRPEAPYLLPSTGTSVDILRGSYFHIQNHTHHPRYHSGRPSCDLMQSILFTVLTCSKSLCSDRKPRAPAAEGRDERGHIEGQVN